MTPLPLLDTIGERLAYARRRMGLTRAQLEARLRDRGVARASVMTIRRNETGVRSPTVAEAVAMASLADVPVGWLVVGRVAESGGWRTAERELILGHVEAELLREEEAERPADARAAFERVDARMERLRAEGGVTEAGWAYWLALRRGAQLFVRCLPDEGSDPD